jgi:hypothetical protein
LHPRHLLSQRSAFCSRPDDGVDRAADSFGSFLTILLTGAEPRGHGFDRDNGDELRGPARPSSIGDRMGELALREGDSLGPEDIFAS